MKTRADRAAASFHRPRSNCCSRPAGEDRQQTRIQQSVSHVTRRVGSFKRGGASLDLRL